MSRTDSSAVLYCALLEEEGILYSVHNINTVAAVRQIVSWVEAKIAATTTVCVRGPLNVFSYTVLVLPLVE